MSLRVKVSYEGNAAQRLREIAAQLANPVALYKDAGRRVANDLRKHFAELDQKESPQHGARSTHFWAEVRDATGNPVMESDGVSVSVNHLAFAQKVFGGTISAKNGKWLTIPIDPQAHGRRVAVYEEETGNKLFRPLGRRLLMAAIDGAVVPVYALATSVVQEADPQALPSEEEIEGAVVDTAERHLARMLARDA